MKKALRVWTRENWRHEKSKVHVYPPRRRYATARQSRYLLDVHQKQEMFQIRTINKHFSFPSRSRRFTRKIGADDDD